MNFIKTSRPFDLKWIPESDWPAVCQRDHLTIHNHPLESLVGLAYNNQNQVVQVTRNVHQSHSIYYVTRLENESANKTLVSTRSHMTIEHTTENDAQNSGVADFSLLDLHVRQEGLGERGLLLEAFIQDIEPIHPRYRVSGDFEVITHQGRVSKECFTLYGFEIHENHLVLNNFNVRRLAN